MNSFIGTAQNEEVLKFIHTNISDYRRVVEIHYYQGNSYFEIHTYEKSPSGNYTKVSRKCLRISLEVLAVFIDNYETISEAASILTSGVETQLNIHLGELLFLKIDRGIRCIDIRKYFIPQETESIQSNLKPGFPGIGLTVSEFNNFANLLPQLIELTEVKSVIPCSRKSEHNVTNCKICNPLKLFYT